VKRSVSENQMDQQVLAAWILVAIARMGLELILPVQMERASAVLQEYVFQNVI